MNQSDQKEEKPSQCVYFRASTTIVLWGLIAIAVYFDRPLILSTIIIILGVLGINEFMGMLSLKKTRISIIKALTLIGSFSYLFLLNLQFSGQLKIEVGF